MVECICKNSKPAWSIYQGETQLYETQLHEFIPHFLSLLNVNNANNTNNTNSNHHHPKMSINWTLNEYGLLDFSRNCAHLLQNR